MSAGHTSGPWTVNTGHVDGSYRIQPTLRSDQHATVIATVEGDPATRYANAQLIARAPDLLADNERLRAANTALRADLAALLAGVETFAPKYAADTGWNGAVLAARAALAVTP